MAKNEVVKTLQCLVLHLNYCPAIMKQMEAVETLNYRVQWGGLAEFFFTIQQMVVLK